MLEELLLHQFVWETDLVYFTLLAQFDLKNGESLFSDSQSVPARDSCGVIPYTNGGTVGYCSLSCPFLCER